MFRKKKELAERDQLNQELSELKNELERLEAYPSYSSDRNYRWGVSFSNEDLLAERARLLQAIRAEASVVEAKKAEVKVQESRIVAAFAAGLEQLRSGVGGAEAYGVLHSLYELVLEARELHANFRLKPAQEEELARFSLGLALDPAARRAAQLVLLRDYLMRFDGAIADIAESNLEHFLTPEVLVRQERSSRVDWEDALLSVPGGFRREPLVVACIRGDTSGADITGMSEAEVETLAVLLGDDPGADVKEAAEAARALEDA